MEPPVRRPFVPPGDLHRRSGAGGSFASCGFFGERGVPDLSVDPTHIGFELDLCTAFLMQSVLRPTSQSFNRSV